MTTTTTVPTATAADRVRQWTVAVGAVIAMLGAAWGSGAFGGTPIQDAAGGALAADATLLAPDSPAFAIWSAIYAALVVFAVVQLLPSRATDARMRAVSWWILASMVLNAVWIGVVQAGWLWLSVLVIAVLVAVLGVVARRLAATEAANPLDLAATEITVGLYLGWAAVATVANIAAAGRDAIGADAGEGTVWAILALAAVAVLASVIAVRLRWRPALAMSVGVAMAWGLGWIAAGRAEGEPHNIAVMWAAGVAAAIAFAAPFAAFDFRRDHRMESVDLTDTDADA
ncbi:tryptophan-rich sensory protein [Demequina sp. NBRC 110057]|uniref:tryptophan-rich sensory protein n=1 Tax=Demequina sp. NBRC 110057 TaxID=1570346 RepID=UPI00190EA35A|nr:tryptophan-rich sensory protein [Demequina sp. NBRC 110057]